MTSRLDPLIDDLVAEFELLDELLASLPAATLLVETPAEGWAVRDQLSHLAGFDDAARLALVAPDRFLAELDRMITESDDPIARYLTRGREMSTDAVVTWWRDAHEALVAAARVADPAVRVPWFGPPMSSMSFLTARLMEIWAHGQDIRDAVGAPPSRSARLRHIAHLGVGAMAYSFAVNERPVPEVPIDVELRDDDGEIHRWGPGNATDRVSGPLLDFCLLVTQRRHRDDVALDASGPTAIEWLSIAQAFAGGPGTGRAPVGK